MKKIFGVFLLTLCLLNFISAQDKDLLRAPEGWRGEIIPFPLPFAPEIKLKGIEDIRFAPGWGSVGATDFWTYSFVWYLDEDAKLSEERLNETMSAYFDGLMKAVAKSKNIPIQEVEETIANFQKQEKAYVGKIRFYDSFFTREIKTLNVKVREFKCQDPVKYSVLFSLSPKEMKDPLWKVFEDVTIIPTCK